MTLKLFVALKGHPLSRDAFEAMLNSLGGIEPTMVDHPAAALLLNPEGMAHFDAILFYDMPGLDFRVPHAERPGALEPTAAFKRGFEAVLAAGKGVVALHHAIAGWPAWPFYADALGGQFLYKDMGTQRSSFYAGDVTYNARVCDPAHPVVKGLPPEFELTDELYAYRYFGTGTPLLECATALEPGVFKSAMRAVRREQQPADETPAALQAPLAWVKPAGASPLVYIQPGDQSATYQNPHFKTLLGNAIRWVASDEAHTWARR